MKNNSQFEMNAEYFHYSDRLKIISTDESLKIKRKSSQVCSQKIASKLWKLY